MKYADIDALAEKFRARLRDYIKTEREAMEKRDEEMTARAASAASAFVESYLIAKEEPGVDAVIVTRCKDCAFMGAECNCTINRRQTQPGGYCDRGVRWDA